ncbi:hypothetical protein Poli38472_006194 [Pythium oligandrum]|uniref:Aminotransferase class I/classII large domain-containing protein n=1 Tax=Pythium oligandrum TaxID=41045 RepID=A0A8K1CU82_PYTOL|nr:hypothetical protein Poli38472_006194 [Pythium oligandrum]|eukprot:TMW68726.1 hypothetical protein Poli38472_006194 [Pythium oligandrum]
MLRATQLTTLRGTRGFAAKRNVLVDRLRDELAAIDAAGTYKRERVIASPQGAEITVNGASVLNFCANNYLGLSNHPAIVEAAKQTLDSHGFGLSSVRFICGTQDIHKQLEKVIADFHGTEDTILYPSCFDANAGLFEATLSQEDAIITDELNHASIIDGVRLCKAERHRFKHMDLADLEAKLKETQHCRTRLIVTDGVFSMDGDVAPLQAICDLADKYNAQVFIDECHATGFFGPTGRGSDEYCGVQGRIDIINSTLGKALGGGTGGYTTGRKEVIDILRQRSRPYLFSNSLSPPVVGASLKVFEMLSESSEYVDRIRENTHRFRDRMTAAGFTLKGARDHPIAPVMIGDARLAAELADDMLQEGIYVIGFSYPVVPKGQARIRVQLSAAHSLKEVDEAVDAFIKCGKARGIIN